MPYPTADVEADVRAHLGPDLPTDIDDTLTRDIERTIASLWPYVWKKATEEITPDGTFFSSWYELPADYMDLILAAQVKSDDVGVGFFGARKSRKPINFSHNLPDTISATGIGVQFPQGFFSDKDIVVTYRAKITADVTTADYDDLDPGLLTECVAYGAAARIAQAQAHERVNSNDTKMWDQSIAPDDRIKSWQLLQQKYVEYRNNIHEELMITSRPARMRYS